MELGLWKAELDSSFTIYVNEEPLMLLLNSRRRGRSSRINAVALRYLLLIKSAAPKLQLREWTALVMALSNTILQDHSLLREGGLARQISEADQHEDLATRAGVAIAPLVTKLQSFGTAEIIATLEVVEQLLTLIDEAIDEEGVTLPDGLRPMLERIGVQPAD